MSEGGSEEGGEEESEDSEEDVPLAQMKRKVARVESRTAELITCLGWTCACTEFDFRTPVFREPCGI